MNRTISWIRAVLTDSVKEHRCPSWAPDGRQFTVATWSPSGSALLVVDVASGSSRKVLATSDTSYLDCPQWSPEGEELLVSVYYGGYPWTAPRTDARSDPAILDLHGGGLRFVTADHDKLNNYGRWSRDARWIVFQSDRHTPPFRDSTATPIASIVWRFTSSAPTVVVLWQIPKPPTGGSPGGTEKRRASSS
jgi:Tol biopolymer transport system component